jgi:hypothetical protein
MRSNPSEATAEKDYDKLNEDQERLFALGSCGVQKDDFTYLAVNFIDDDCTIGKCTNRHRTVQGLWPSRL